MFRWVCVAVIIVSAITLTQGGKCPIGLQGNVPRSIYHDLRCTLVHSDLSADCPIKYDCSNIYERPKDTCQFQGKRYSIGDAIPNGELFEIFSLDCKCTESLEFECAELSSGCTADLLPGYPEPGCYLKYELNSNCATDQVCPPFDKNAKCDVKGGAYREGDKFSHPDEKCVQCVCDKGFDGKFEPPFCQPVNCTTEIQHSKDRDDHCAPYYDYTTDSCCPKTWVCPSKNGKFTHVGIPSDEPASEYSCQFGDNVMQIGDYYKHEDEKLGPVYCHCNVPPFADCQKQQKATILEI